MNSEQKKTLQKAAAIIRELVRENQSLKEQLNHIYKQAERVEKARGVLDNLVRQGIKSEYTHDELIKLASSDLDLDKIAEVTEWLGKSAPKVWESGVFGPEGENIRGEAARKRDAYILGFEE